MTQQEAQKVVTKLTRIWQPERVDYWHLVNGKLRLEFSFRGLSGVHLQSEGVYWIEIAGEEAALLWSEHKGRGTMHSFSVQGERKTAQRTTCVQAFESQWFPLFRRGLWLSGCAIEATAHEKAQGLSREEVEAWDLCF